MSIFKLCTYVDRCIYKTPKNWAARIKSIPHPNFFFWFFFLGNFPITLYYPNSIYN